MSVIKPASEERRTHPAQGRAARVRASGSEGGKIGIAAPNGNPSMWGASAFWSADREMKAFPSRSRIPTVIS